jgi:hypothetical protein
VSGNFLGDPGSNPINPPSQAFAQFDQRPERLRVIGLIPQCPENNFNAAGV